MRVWERPLSVCCGAVQMPLRGRGVRKTGPTMSQFAFRRQMRFIKRLKMQTERFCCGQHGEACRLCGPASRGPRAPEALFYSTDNTWETLTLTYSNVSSWRFELSVCLLIKHWLIKIYINWTWTNWLTPVTENSRMNTMAGDRVPSMQQCAEFIYIAFGGKTSVNQVPTLRKLLVSCIWED